MPERSIAKLFKVQPRFLRSTHLERDFADPGALAGYVLTPHVIAELGRIAEGLRPQSGARAWRVTGDYGTGKSSFGLLLAHVLAGSRDLPKHLGRGGLTHLGAGQPSLVPVLVTGSRDAMSTALVRALARTVGEIRERGRAPRVVERLRLALDGAEAAPVADESALGLLEDTLAYVTSSQKGGGLLVILDELGKFLEYAASHPTRQDVYFLQRLAEMAARSGPTPLVVVGILHQGVDAYAEPLSQAMRKEWEKVAGRYEEVPFAQPVEETARLVAEALGVRVDRLTDAVRAAARRDMKTAIALGWYGPSFGREELLGLADRLYPLHPTVLPVLVRLFRRFGQNERSLFGFLFSEEPSGLRAFADREVSPSAFYRLSELFDYARATFGYRLNAESYRSHWSHIESVVASFHVGNDHELRVLKTVGLINLLGDVNLVATDRLVPLAVGGERATQALAKLHKEKRVLYYRGTVGGYCLWPHTSVNLDAAHEAAMRAVPALDRVAPHLAAYLETRPLVARRHYVETGNLRHFEVHYVQVGDLAETLATIRSGADGHIVIPLAETAADRAEALALAASDEARARADVLVAVPQPLSALGRMADESRRWRWVAENTPELTHDRYAAEEVSRQIAQADRTLESRLLDFIGLRQSSGRSELEWYRGGERVHVESGRALLELLSDVADEIYAEAPRVLNELVNRRSLSSSAAGARLRLIERFFENAAEPLLGMDPSKTPPEMSMYLSVVKAGGLHVRRGAEFALAEPKAANDPLRLLPALREIRRLLDEAPDRRIPVPAVFERLRQAPYGARDGLIPVLLAVFAVTNERDLAFYENGAFVRHLDGMAFHRLIKAPQTFAMQYCRIVGPRADLFERLAEVLGVERSQPERAELLDVVRPLCVFAAQLPAYTHRSGRLSAAASGVRDALLKAEEPATMLFSDLPRACGYEPIAARRPAPRDIEAFVEGLKESIEELREAYPGLLGRVRDSIQEAFDRGGPVGAFRVQLADRAERMLVAVNEPRLKAFSMRLIDPNLPEAEWLESVASFVVSKPPAKWSDVDEETFGYELATLVRRFLRAEALAFELGAEGRAADAYRVAITRADGTEVDRIVQVGAGDARKVAKLEAYLTELLSKDAEVGLVAATRAFWKVLSEKQGGDS